MIDDSYSMSPQEFEEEKEFLLKLIDELHPRPEGAHVSITKFSYLTVTPINFNSIQDEYLIKETIKNLNFTNGGATLTHWTLDDQLNDVFNETNGMRNDSNIPKNLVVITDGACNCKDHHLKERRDKFKSRGIRIIAVGIGGKENATDFRKHLHLLTDNKADVHEAASFGDLKKFVENVSYCTGNLILCTD